MKVEYPVHCAMEESLCKDHCRRFALSDPENPDFKENCSHEHVMKCEDCEKLKFVLGDIEERIHSTCSFSNMGEQQQDLLYDLKQASTDILAWKVEN